MLSSKPQSNLFRFNSIRKLNEILDVILKLILVIDWQWYPLWNCHQMNVIGP